MCPLLVSGAVGGERFEKPEYPLLLSGSGGGGGKWIEEGEGDIN